jgi:hypothetical protein
MMRVVVARMMVVMVMVMAREGWHRHRDYHDKKHGKQLFHGGIIARNSERKSSAKAKGTRFRNSFLS